MDDFDDREIATLLRLKRHEQPPPGYFENFLHEFHRRQRDELLRQPLWRICLDRANDFMFRLNFARLTSYPAAVAAVLICAAVVSIRIYQEPQTPNIAARTDAAFTLPVETNAEWTLASPVATRVFTSKPLRSSNKSGHTHPRNAGTPPRYVLDSVPVSYEPTFRF
jgi:hypothetical protein